MTEPDELAEVIEQLGQAVAKVHCVSDTDSDQTLVDFQTEDAIVAVIGDDKTTSSATWSLRAEYATTVRTTIATSSRRSGRAGFPESVRPNGPYLVQGQPRTI